MRGFAPLRGAHDDLVSTALAGAAEFGEFLDQLTRDVRRVTDMYRGERTTLGGFRRGDFRQQDDRPQGEGRGQPGGVHLRHRAEILHAAAIGRADEEQVAGCVGFIRTGKRERPRSGPRAFGQCRFRPASACDDPCAHDSTPAFPPGRTPSDAATL